MAVEVDHEDYLFLPTETSESVDTLKAEQQPASSKNAAERRAARKARQFDRIEQPPAPTITTSKTPLRYNPLHDCESLWWIAAYFILNMESWAASDQGSSEQPQPQSMLTLAQREYAGELFYGQAARMAAIYSGTKLENFLLYDLPPHFTRPIVEQMVYLRRVLSSRYRQIEKDLSTISKGACGPLYDAFDVAFTEIARQLNGQDIFVTPISHRSRGGGTKAGRASAIGGSARKSVNVPRKRRAGASVSTNSKKAKVSTQE